jgi:hypothetical protein
VNPRIVSLAMISERIILKYNTLQSV